MATDFSAFRPEIWAAEFAMYFGAQPGVIDTVTRFDYLAGDIGGFGYTIKIPALHLSAAAAITPGSAATLATVNNDTITLTLDQMTGMPIQVTPQDERFSHSGARQGAMADAARLIKNQMNTTLATLVDDGSVNATPANASTGGGLIDADVLKCKSLLDEAEFPPEDRVLLVGSDAAADLLGISTFIDGDFNSGSPGNNQNKVQMCRGFRVVQLPNARFPITTTVNRMMAYHPMAIGAAVARPHLELVRRGGLFDAVIETAAIWGYKIRKGAGIIKVYR